ncbi:MAG: hypothetical protein ACI4KG_02995 [Oscillospiraceae bacterium]
MIMMTIEASPEQAIEIARILGSPSNPVPVQTAPSAPVIPVQQQAPIVPPVAASVPQVPPVAPVQAPPVRPAAPVTPPPVQQAPPVAARKYTQDELALASRPVCEAGRQTELLNLLHSFTYTDSAGNVQQVQSIQQLPEESYPAFANGIRALGGKI